MNKSIGIILKYYRKKMKMSQSTLAEGICVPSYLSKIENSEVIPTRELLKNFAQKLDIDICDSFDSKQYDLCDKAIDAVMNLRDDRALEIYNSLDEGLSLSDYALKFFILKHKFDETSDLTDIITTALTYLNDNQAYEIALILYSTNKSNRQLLDQYFSYCGYGYYLMASDMNSKKLYKKALHMFKESERLYFEDGHLRGFLYAIKTQGLIFASIKDYELAELVFIRLEKLLNETGDNVFSMEKQQNAYNLNYIKYILNKPNQMEILLEENINTSNFDDATMHLTLIAIYCKTSREKALKIIDDGLTIFNDKNSYDYKQLSMEKSKIIDENYLESTSYYDDLKWLIEFLSDRTSHLEYHARVLEMIEFLKLKRRYKEALELTDLMNSKK